MKKSLNCSCGGALDPSSLTITLATPEDVPQITKLVNGAYKQLLDLGLNYTAATQDDARTLQRIQKGRAFIIKDHSEILATILFSQENHFTKRHTAYVGQFAVTPTLKKQGLGTLLLDHCEALARSEGYEGLQLDTAIPAVHLVQWYLKRGYKIVGQIHWEGKTYDSYFFEKLF